MRQFNFNTGATLIVDSLSFFPTFNTQDVTNNEIRILVDSSVSRTVRLPRASAFPARNVWVTIIDISGNAAVHPITITTTTGLIADTIEGSSSLLISSNYGAVRLEVMGSNKWFVMGGNLSSSSSSGVVNIVITATDFVGNDYTNPLLVGLAAMTDFNVWTNGGSGTLLLVDNGYSFNGTTGTITTSAENYLIQII